MSEETVYCVFGAEYRDTDFHDLVPGTSAVHGPYTKPEADKKWQELSMARVDECMVRFRVVDRDKLVNGRF